jgi:predicted nucleotidyltransferase
MRKTSTSSVRIFYPRFDTAWLVRALRARIERLGALLPLRRVVLFGSYATGRYTVGSDVDLLVVYQGEPRPDAYALVKRTLNIPGLEPHLYTEAECEALASTVARMVETGVEILP